jgi:hypothetical protein
LNFEISRIRTEVIHLQQNGVLEYGEQYVIFTIPESVIRLLSELDLPTIHKVLEVMLFYSSYTSRLYETDEVLYAYLEQYLDTEVLYKAIKIVTDNDLINKLEEALFDVYDIAKGIFFYGWTIKKDSISRKATSLRKQVKDSVQNLPVKRISEEIARNQKGNRVDTHKANRKSARLFADLGKRTVSKFFTNSDSDTLNVGRAQLAVPREAIGM